MADKDTLSNEDIDGMIQRMRAAGQPGLADLVGNLRNSLNDARTQRDIAIRSLAETIMNEEN